MKEKTVVTFDLGFEIGRLTSNPRNSVLKLELICPSQSGDPCYLPRKELQWK